METYRSGHNGNDSKSFDRQKRSVGSNPTVSARETESAVWNGRFLFARCVNIES